MMKFGEAGLERGTTENLVQKLNLQFPVKTRTNSEIVYNFQYCDT